MIDFIQPFNPVTQALLVTIFTWLVAAVGAALVFFTKTVNNKLLDSIISKET